MMADHDELVSEMAILETMGTQERQKLAKKRRLQQLKRWGQREKEWIAKEKQLNKRLANIMSEENNGLNLRQYTTYNSNQRTRKQLVNSAEEDGKNIIANNKQSNGVAGKEFNNNNTTTHKGPYSNSLQPNGRIHFNVGVMLLEAAARNDYDEVKRLLALGVSPDSVNHDGLTALHQCCIDASEPMMQLLLDYGANVDARDTEQWTPLHAACTCGHLNLVKILVKHKADLLSVNGDGNMPFDICEDEATLDFIESQMVEQGITQEMIDLTRASNEMNMLNELEEMASNQADLNGADENGVTRLHIAATNNYLSAVKFLLNQGINVNVCDNDQWQPLHGVACWGTEQHIKVIELLVEAGANLDAKTLNDETVFDLCDNVELLERMNQLKDELESKQAKGTGRLKRTQSRTNSRVHSVRRTSVRDKNQISRREAREEAMLRVDSNSEVAQVIAPSGSAKAVGENLKLQDAEPQASGEQRSSEFAQDSYSNENVDSINTTETKPKVTDLDDDDDEIDEQRMNEHPHYVGEGYEEGDDRTKVQQQQYTIGSQQSLVASLDATNETEKSHSNGGAVELLNRPRVTGAQVIEMNLNPIEQRTPSVSLDPAIVSVNHRHQSDGTSSLFEQVCDPIRSATNYQPQQQQQQASTTVQVQFASTNYTLANLKKHRSDMRLRSCNGVSLTSLNNVDSVRTSNSLQVTLSPATNGLDAPDPDANGTMQFKLESNHSRDNSVLSRRNNGVLSIDLLRPESPSSTFRKFRGEPSQTLETESDLRSRRECCIVI